MLFGTAFWSINSLSPTTTGSPMGTRRYRPLTGSAAQ